MARTGQAGNETDEDVAGLGDAGVGHHALDIGLHSSHDVPQGHREDGDDGDRNDQRGEIDLPEAAIDEDANESGKASSLGADREEGRRWSWSAFVDVRGPHVEWDGGDFEAETGEDQYGGYQDNEVAGLHTAGDGGGDAFQISGSGKAIEQGETVQQNGRGHSTQQYIFDGSLRRALAAANEAGHYVKWDTGELKRNIDGDEFARTCHEHHARDDDEEDDLEEDGVGIHYQHIKKSMVLNQCVVGDHHCQRDRKGQRYDKANQRDCHRDNAPLNEQIYHHHNEG